MNLCRLTVLALMLLFCALSSHAQDQEVKPGEDGQQAVEEQVAAVVNGNQILAAEVSALVERQLRGRNVPPQVAQQVREETLELIINWRLVEQFLQENRIKADARELEEILRDIKQRAGEAGVQLSELLKRQGQTEASLRRQVEGKLAFQQYADTQITERKVQDYFDDRKEEFDGTQVRASHLLIKVDESADAQAVAAAEAKIHSIRGEIVDGLEFAEAAKKYSEGPSGPQGGDVGFFPRHNRMVEPFAEAAFSLNQGELSEPVETRFGLHLIHVTDRRQGTRQLADVRDEIVAKMTRDLWESAASQQRQSADIEIIDQNADAEEK